MAQNPFLQSPFDAIASQDEEDAALLPGQQATTKAAPLPQMRTAEPAPAPKTEPTEQRRPSKSDNWLPPANYRPLFESAAQKYDVPVNVLMALGHQESRYNPAAIGTQTEWGRAKGMMQYLDDTAKGLGINPFDPAQAVDAAAKQIRERLDKGYSMADAVKEHFAGPDRKKWGAKTAAYGDEVMSKAFKIGELAMGEWPAAAAEAAQSDTPDDVPADWIRLTPEQAAEIEAQQASGTVVMPAVAPPQEQGFFGRAGQAVSEGYDDMVQSLGTARFAVSGGDSAELAKAMADKFARQQSRPKTEGEKEIDDAFRKVTEAQGAWDTTVAGIKAIGTSIANPADTAVEIARQAPNMLPSLGGGAAGAGTGAAVGAGVGALAGGVGAAPGAVGGAIWGGRAGMVAGTTAVELGAEVEHMVLENLGARQLPPTEQNIKALLDDESFRAAARDQGLKKGLTVGVVDQIFLGLGGKVMGKAASATTKTGKAALGAAAVGADATGEVVGEAASQKVARGKVDAGDALREGVMSLGQSVVEPAVGAGMRAVAGRRQAQSEQPAAPADVPAEQAAPAAPVAPVDAEATVAPVPQQPAAQPAQTSTAPGPLSRSIENAAEQNADQPNRVTATAEDGSSITGQVAEQAQDEDGNLVTTILGDDGQTYTFSDADGVQLAPADKADTGPLSASVAVAAEDHAANPAPMPEPPRVPVKPAEPDYASMELPQLRERLKYIAQQAKASGGMNKMFVEHRRAVEKAINAKTAEAKEASKPADEPLTFGPFDQRAAANKMMLRHAEATGQPHEVVEADGKFTIQSIKEQSDAGVDTAGYGARDGSAQGAQDAAPVGADQPRGREGDQVDGGSGPAVAGEAVADAGPAVPGASQAADGQPALADPGAGRRFARPEKAAALVAKNNLSETHEVKQTGKVRWEVKPKAAEAAQSGNPMIDNPASWVIREKGTGKVIMETFDRKKVDALNTEKYEAVPAYQHLVEVNDQESLAGKVARGQTEQQQAAADAGTALKPKAETQAESTASAEQEPAAAPEPQSASDWSQRMADLRKVKPRPLEKMYGKNPTDEQKAKHAADEKAWNREYRKASKMQKEALARDNAAFQARQDEIAAEKAKQAAEQQAEPEAANDQVPAEAVADRAPPADQPADKPSNRVSEAGDELTYNRRNRIRAGLKWSDVENMNDALKAKETVKAKVWLKPDYDAMIADGMQPLVAHIVKQVYDAISAKPQVRGTPGDADFKRYIEAINTLRDGVMAWAQDDKAVAAWLGKIGDRASRMLGKQVALPDLGGTAPKGLLDTVYPAGWRASQNEVVVMGGNKVLRALQPSTDEAVKALKEIEKGWPSPREAWQVQGYKVLPASSYDVSSSGFGKFNLRLDGRFVEQYDTREEAEVALAGSAPFTLTNKLGRAQGAYQTEAEAIDAARELVKRESKNGPVEEGMNVADVERTGTDRRAGEDVTAQRLMDDFGFRGVNFGKWVPDNERQLHLNHAYDSFHDLAETLGLPPQALSLNGMLGIAFGAQGGGKALAHFVPGVNEINITRTNGAGSLAHEWAHALDHYFATQAGLSTTTDPFLTAHSRLPASAAVRPEIADAFRRIVSTMEKRQETRDEMEQRLARAKEAAIKRVDQWLAAIRRDFKGHEERFDAIAARIKAGDLGGDMITAGKSLISPTVNELRELYKQATGRTYSLDQITGLQSNVDHLKFITDDTRAARKHEPQKVSTEYAKKAAELDKNKGGKGYWRTPWEMFARAFDAYVSDKLEAKVAKNTYLSHAGRTGETVPTGTEREAINQAFADLIQGIETREEGGKPVMYSVAGDAPSRDPQKARASNKIEDKGAKDRARKQGWNPDSVWFHNTKSTFDKFDLKKIGQGTGAATEGWGIYFASLKKNAARFGGKQLPVVFLNWVSERIIHGEKPISDNPKVVRDVLMAAMPDTLKKWPYSRPITGYDFYVALAKEMKSQRGASQFLSRMGVVGMDINAVKDLYVVEYGGFTRIIWDQDVLDFARRADDDFLEENEDKEGLGPFRPNQKGATGNNSDFDQDNQDIRYSVESRDTARAIEQLMNAQSGEATVQHPQLGPITISYGDARSGIAHIAKRRGAAFMERLPALLRNGEVYTKPGQNDRIFIGNERDEAVIRQDRDGKAENWLLSAYEKHPDLPPAQSTRQSTEEEAPFKNLSVEELKDAITVGTIGPVISRLIENGNIVIHRSAKTLPKELGKVPAGVQALTMPDGTIHFVAGSLGKENARAVLLHEMFHKGGEALIGSKEWANLMGRMGSLYRQSEQSSGKAREFYDRARERVAAAKAKGAVTTRMEVEEFAAYAIEEYERSPDSLPAAIRKWVEDLIGFVKAYMVKRYGKQLGQVTSAQLSAFAKMAVLDVAAARRGELFGPAGEWFSVAAGITDTPAFQRWFKGSKVVDENGKPLVVYHGTRADFAAFDPAATAANPWLLGDDNKNGFFFTTDPGRRSDSGQWSGAAGYAGTRQRDGETVASAGANVMPVYLSIKSPYVMTAAEYRKTAARPEFKEELEVLGYDGVQIDDGTFIAFAPEQIKSATGNAGTFDPDNADIRYSVGASTGTPAGSTTATPAATGSLELTPPEQGLLRRLQSQVQDNMNRVRQVQDRIMELTGRTALGKSDYYGAETNRPGRIAARLEDAREHLTKPLMERLAASGHTPAQLSELLHAMHAKERNARVAEINPKHDPASPEYIGTQGSGMNDDKADAILKQYAGNAELHAMATEARDIAKATLDLKLAYGLLTKEDHEALAKAYDNYVPLKGDGEYGPKNKRAMGHEEREEHILENIARDYDQAVVVGEKNLARQSLLRMVLEFKDDALWTARVPPKGRRIAGKVYNVVDVGPAAAANGTTVGSFTSRSQVDAFLEGAGPARMNYKVLDSNGEQVVEFARPLQDNEVMVYVKGEPVRIQIHDEQLARQLRPLNAAQLPPILEFFRGVNRYLSKIYTGYNPAFMLRNAARDAITGTINILGHEGGAITAKAWAKYPAAWNAMRIWAKTKEAPSGKVGQYLNEYRMHGGKTGASWMSDLEQQGATLQEMFDDARGIAATARDGGGWRASKVAWNKSIGKLADVVEVHNQAFENALRLSLYIALREEGATAGRAAQAAKQVTVDFDRKGSSTGMLGALYLFFNPAIQGSANAFKTLSKGAHREQAWAALGGLALAGVYAASAGMGEDRDRWLGEEWEARTKNFILNIGEHQLRIPLSQEFAPVYALGVALAEGWNGESKTKTAARVVSSFIDAYFPFRGAYRPDSDNHLADLSMAMAPTVAQPLAQTAFNRNVFGSQVTPETEFTKDRPDNLKMFRGTKNSAFDTTAQGIAWLGVESGMAGKYENDITKVSPETLKLLWRTYTGGLGQFITDSIGLTMMAGAPGQIEIGDVPIAKDFIRDNDVKPIAGHYHDLARDARAAITEFEQAKKAGDGEAIRDIMSDADKARLVGLGRMVRATGKAAAAMGDRKVDINANQSLTGAEKREKLKEIERQEEVLYRSAIRAFR